MASRETPTVQERLRPLFRPESIAVIGASPDGDKPNGRPLVLLRRFGFPGRIYPVNPKYREIAGMPCYATVTEVQERVDLAIIAVASSRVLPVIEECVRAGVRSAMIYSSGFAELDPNGVRAQERIRAIAAESGMRVLGPNCQGIVDVGGRVCTAWSSIFAAEDQLRQGALAWVSQSGAMGAVAFDLFRRAGIDVNYWVSTGNEADVTVTEAMAYVLEDPSTRVVCGYVEGVRDADGFRVMAERARALNKPVILLKGGMTPVGAAATQSHTGTLAGEAAVYRAFFRQTGVILAEDVHDMVGTAMLALACPAPRSRPRVAILSNSGGMGVMLADICHEFGLSVPALPSELKRRVAALLPPFINPANPVDVSTMAMSDPDLVAKLLLALRESGAYDVFLLFLMGLHDKAGYDTDGVLRSIQRARRESGCPVVPIFLASQDDVVTRARALGLPAFTDVRRAVLAIRHLESVAPPADNEARQGSTATVLGSRTVAANVPAEGHRATPTIRASTTVLSEAETKSRLRERGLPVVDGRLARTAEEAKAAARAIGFPVVLKVTSPDIVHKSDFGGVRLDLHDEPSVVAAFHEVTTAARSHHPGARIEGVLVEEMIAGGVEVVLGVRRDPTLGPVLLFGLGGVFVEVLGDVALRVLPIDAAEARRMVSEIRGYPLLMGARGREPADVDALVETMLAVAAFAMEAGDALQELDLNPVAVLPRGEGVRILDALCVLRR